MSIKGIIFDLDGVIVFTDRFHYKAWKQVAEKIGAPFDETLNNRLRGVSRMESLEIILNNAGIEIPHDEKEKIASEKNEIYRIFLGELTPESIEPGTRDVLKELRRRGLKLAIGSSSKNASTILANTELTDYFDAVSDGNNISRSKPDPEVFIKAAVYINLPPEECIVVEDAYAGIDAAKAGGFYAVGIGDAAGYEKSDVSITALQELLELKKHSVILTI
jgi:beta-phosphoglucomutase